MTWNDFDMTTRLLAKNIKKSKIQYVALCGIPRGGLTIAVRLSHLLKLPLIEKENLDLMDKRILIVDDIADTGKTLQFYVSYGYPTATLFWNPKSVIQPTFWVKKKASKKWVVFPWEMR